MDAVVFYFYLQMAEMLCNVASKKKEIPLYIYIYKLKSITLMQ